MLANPSWLNLGLHTLPSPSANIAHYHNNKKVGSLNIFVLHNGAIQITDAYYKKISKHLNQIHQEEVKSISCMSLDNLFSALIKIIRKILLL